MDVEGHEEHRRTHRVGCLDDAAAIHVAADMFHRVEGQAHIGGIVHGQDHAGDDLDRQAHDQDGAEGPPVIEVLRRGEVHQVLF
ncbi:hypothetical protein D3C87_1892540 [compost metagenome]